MVNETKETTQKKRSAGVTVVASLIILLSIIRLLGTGSIGVSFSFLSKSTLMLIVIYSIISNIGNIIAATSAYRLKGWSRNTLVVLAAVQIIYMLFISIPLSNRSIEALKTSPESKEKIISGYESVPEDVRAQKNITEEEYIKLIFRFIYIIANIIRIVSLIYLALIIFFFTRPEVKKQFLK